MSPLSPLTKRSPVERFFAPSKLIPVIGPLSEIWHLNAASGLACATEDLLHPRAGI
jgi:hypothetical protein